jgi:hypothetical protein
MPVQIAVPNVANFVDIQSFLQRIRKLRKTVFNRLP